MVPSRRYREYLYHHMTKVLVMLQAKEASATAGPKAKAKAKAKANSSHDVKNEGSSQVCCLLVEEFNGDI
jgi:hypothetical protein